MEGIKAHPGDVLSGWWPTLACRRGEIVAGHVFFPSDRQSPDPAGKRNT